MSLLDDVTRLGEEVSERIGLADSLDSVKDLKIRYLGRKGPLSQILKNLRDLPDSERKQVGALANKLRAG